MHYWRVVLTMFYPYYQNWIDRTWMNMLEVFKDTDNALADCIDRATTIQNHCQLLHRLGATTYKILVTHDVSTCLTAIYSDFLSILPISCPYPAFVGSFSWSSLGLVVSLSWLAHDSATSAAMAVVQLCSRKLRLRREMLPQGVMATGSNNQMDRFLVVYRGSEGLITSNIGVNSG